MSIAGKYRHFKGKEYEAIGEALVLGEDVLYVLYRQLYAPYSLWIRPKVMFIGYKEVDGKKIKRFEKVSEKKDTDIDGSDCVGLIAIHSETKKEYRVYSKNDNLFQLKLC